MISGPAGRYQHPTGPNPAKEASNGEGALEAESPGMYKLVRVIGNHLDSVIERHFEAERAVNRLAKP